MERKTRGIILVAAALGLAAPAAAQYKVHVYHPWATDPTRQVPPALLMIQGKDPGYYPGAAMTAEGGDWFTYTFRESAPAAGDNFKVVSYIPGPSNPYSDAATFDNNGSSFRMGEVFLTPGFQEVWIIPQGPGVPPRITDIPPRTKALYLFNPWPETAPLIRAGSGAYVPMRLSQDKGRCNWYVHYFTSAEYSVSFRSLVGAETYGAGGAGDPRPLDLAPRFATVDTLFLLPTPLPAGPSQVRTEFPPGTAGQCSFPLAVTVRDFSSAHPDFEEEGMEGRLTKNMVQPTLPADKKPAQGPVRFFQSGFDKWFRTDSTNPNPALRNYETCRDLPMGKDRQGYWTFDSYNEASGSYFPIDDFNRFNQTSMSHFRDRNTGKWVDGGLHNFHFCMEMHAEFTYRQGQVFRFSGDDDVWVYIDNRLAIDLGGTHGPAFDSVALDAMGLTAGRKYGFDLFFCERKTQGSNLLIQTSIFFEQEQTVFARRTALPGSRERYDILEIITGGSYCGASKGGDTLPAASKFTLQGPSATPARELGAGTHHGGIVVDPSGTRITVDTAAMTGLLPGTYTVTFASAKTGRGGSFQFTLVAAAIPRVATPAASPGSVTFLERPLTVTLSTATPGAAIWYTLDGSDPAPGSGTAVRYAAPIALERSATLKAVAAKDGWLASDTLVEGYAFTPARSPRKAWYQDRDGDGRIESAGIDFGPDLPALPRRLAFDIADPMGGLESRVAEAGEIAFAAGSRGLILVTLKSPFPRGLTSVGNAGTSGRHFAQADIPLREARFAVDDSVGPVIAAAEVLEPDSANPLKRVVLELSESARAPADWGTAVNFKRGGQELAAGQVRILRVEAAGDRRFVLSIDSASEAFPVAGDSAALAPPGPAGQAVRDPQGNAPTGKSFQRLEGLPPKPRPVDLWVTFPNGSRETPASGWEGGHAAGAIFIGVGRDGRPLPGQCQGCDPGAGGIFMGPVFHIATPGPVEWRFTLYSHLGEFVARGAGRVTGADLPLLEKANDASGIRYRARVVWSGTTSQGNPAATGAYILHAVLLGAPDPRDGATPGPVTRKAVFGLLRGRR